MNRLGVEFDKYQGDHDTDNNCFLYATRLGWFRTGVFYWNTTYSIYRRWDGNVWHNYQPTLGLDGAIPDVATLNATYIPGVNYRRYDAWITGGLGVTDVRYECIKNVADVYVWQMVGAGAPGNTLGQAYNEGGAGAGRIIDALAGAVRINNNVADVTSALEINRTNALPGGYAINVLSGDVLIADNVQIGGNLNVLGTTVTHEAETVLIADNHLYMNNGYTIPVAQSGGLVVNYLPTATVDTVGGAFVAGVGGVSNPTVVTTGAATYAVGALIQISGANDHSNDGLFEVLSHVANLLTIRGVGLVARVEDFTQDQFTADAVVIGNITQVTVSVIRAGTDGVWEDGRGSVTPLTFSDLAHVPGGGFVTLDVAYDGGGAGLGRQINVDSGAVELIMSATQLTGLYIDQVTNSATQNKRLIDVDVNLNLGLNRFFYLMDLNINELVASPGNNALFGINLQYTSIAGSAKVNYDAFTIGIGGTFDGAGDANGLIINNGATFDHALAYSKGIFVNSTMVLTNYQYAYGVHITMPDDVTPTDNPIYGIYTVMPANYSGADMVGAKFTGDQRTIEIAKLNVGVEITTARNDVAGVEDYLSYIIHTGTVNHANAEVRGQQIELNLMTTTNFNEIIGLFIGMPTDDGGVGNLIQGIRVDMPAPYPGVGAAMMAAQFTGDNRTVDICDTTYALKVTDNIAIVDAGGVNLATLVMNGVDLEITNATALGDINIDGTTDVNIDGASAVKIYNAGAIKATFGTAITFHVGIAPALTSSLDIGLPTNIWQKFFIEEIGIYDVGGVNNSTFVMNGVDLEITNATALGDIITNATVEIREEINSVVRTILGVNSYHDQFSNNDYDHTIDVYASNASHSPRFRLRKTNNSTLGSFTATTNGSVLGEFHIMGSSGAAFINGMTMEVLQVGASAANAGCDLYIYTRSAAAINTYQLVLRHDASVEIARGAPVKFFDSAENDLTYFEQMEPLATADAVQTTMHTVTLDDNHSYTIEVRVNSMEDDASDVRGFIKSAVFKRDGGGAVQVGVTVSQMNEGSAGVLLDFTTNGNDARVSFTGIALEDWKTTGQIIVVEND